MVGDLDEKVRGSQNKLEQLLARIPGYAGYKQKEQRREADKLLRLYVARQYEDQLRRLNSIAQSAASGGQLRAILPLERASMRLQLLVDRIKTASYGYAGLFDAIKVDEAALDKLYDFDLAMLDGVSRIATLLDNLGEAAASGETGAAADSLLAEIETLNTTFSHRQDLFLE